MRLLIKLEAAKDQAYDAMYHHKVQGFIYDLIESYDPSLHDKKGYKNFCYSNPFPFDDMKEGDIRTLIIASPDARLIEHLYKNLPKGLNIGDNSYIVREKKTLIPRLEAPLKLKTATPVTMRIPKERYSDYGIESDKDWKYWRPENSFEAYVKQLGDNVIKKYNSFYNTEIEEQAIFEQYKYVKPTCNPTIIDGKEYDVVGSIWEYHFTHLTPQQKKLLEYALDAGIGERNTYGYGFLNVIKVT
jgi:CRISPR-associated endoribonuclease Cas6